MIRLHIIAEGQTEEEFVKSVLTQHLGNFNISTDVRCVTTNPRLKKRGGVNDYKKVRRDIELWLKQDQNPEARFTTMFDFYALPNEFPQFNLAQKQSDSYQKIKILETALADDIKDQRFIPYLQLHEFEALVLTDPSKLIESFPNAQTEINQLSKICEQFQSPELINDGKDTAPSKRIIKLIPSYKGSKVSVAPLLVSKIGLNLIRKKCHHFNEWLNKLENLNESN